MFAKNIFYLEHPEDLDFQQLCMQNAHSLKYPHYFTPQCPFKLYMAMMPNYNGLKKIGSNPKSVVADYLRCKHKTIRSNHICYVTMYTLFQTQNIMN